jgi:hypothetical protein
MVSTSTCGKDQVNHVKREFGLSDGSDLTVPLDRNAYVGKSPNRMRIPTAARCTEPVVRPAAEYGLADLFRLGWLFYLDLKRALE